MNISKKPVGTWLQLNVRLCGPKTKQQHRRSTLSLAGARQLTGLQWQDSPPHLHEQVGREGREARLPQDAALGAAGARDALQQLRRRPLLQARREGNLRNKQCSWCRLGIQFSAIFHKKMVKKQMNKRYYTV